MWKENFSLGIPPMDLQHKKLVGLIDTAMRIVMNAADGVDTYDEIEAVLNELQSYTLEHFRDEEALMMLKGYTGIEEHRMKHDGFIQKIDEFMDSDIDYNQTAVLEEVVQFLLDWLVGHILNEDKKYLAVMM